MLKITGLFNKNIKKAGDLYLCKKITEIAGVFNKNVEKKPAIKLKTVFLISADIFQFLNRYVQFHHVRFLPPSTIGL